MSKLVPKILYGCSDAGVSAVETFIRLHLLVFYSQEIGLPLFWVSIALGISILWDAAIDPLIGRYSDDFKSRKGTRIHLMLMGAIATALCLAALYNPPRVENQMHQWLYLLIISLIFTTCYALFAVPYAAMAGDYSKEREERAGFIAWRLAFANLGTLLGIAIPGYYLIEGHRDAYGSTAWILVMLVLLVAFLTSLAPPAIHRTKSQARELSHPLRQALTNRTFLFPLAAYFFVGIGLTLNTSMALYFYRLRVQIPEKAIQNTLLLFFLVFSLSIPLWLWISRRYGRKKTLIAGSFLIGISNALIYPNLEVGQVLPVYLLASLVGGIFVGCSVLMDSVLTDVIDEDHLQSGQERLGLYFGIWKFASKFSRALALFIVGFWLDWANIAFPDIDTSNRLALIFGPGVGFFFLIAGLLLFAYPLTEEKCAEIKRALEQR